MCANAFAQASHEEPPLAQRPPMGWNSWDSFGTGINESAARDVAQIMARELLPHGYDVFTIDAQWYEPNANGFDYRAQAQLCMDEWGRLVPAPNRFPSAANGAGFKPLADYAHSIGLKFGIHIMRGVPRQASKLRTPILGDNAHANDIADTVNVCTWNGDMYGIDMQRPGTQSYYDSLAMLYAGWGVDYVKADDMSRPYLRNANEIHALKKAIDRCGRPMILSLSPGETALAAATDVTHSANLWRISDDFWDHWPLLLEQFARLEAWSPYAGPGHWPDADMLPLGMLELGKRRTRFTADEQRTLMTLWCIARSPLIMGGDLRQLDPATRALLTNDEVLAVNQRGTHSRQLQRQDDLVAWVSDSIDGDARYLALFNLRAAATGTRAIHFDLKSIGINGKSQVRDAWRKRDLGPVNGVLSVNLPSHGAALYRISV
jgi:alpha-galactosidase